MEERTGYVLGPRVYRGLVFGGLRPSQIAMLSVGGVMGLAIMMLLPLPIVWIFPLSLLVGAVFCGACAAAAFIPIGGLLVADWTPHAVAYFVAAARGKTVWESHAIGTGVTLGEHDELEHLESLPAAFGDLRILDLAGAGVLYDASAQTLCGCLRVHLHAIGLLGDEDQRARYEAFGKILDQLALETDPDFRLQMLKRVVPRQQNELLAYLDEMIVDPRAPQARTLYDLAAGRVDRDHELFVVIRQGVRHRTVIDHDRVLLAAAANLKRHLERMDGMLQKAGIALKVPDPVLDARQYARLIKDQVDPFGVEMRSQLEYRAGEHGIDPEQAWPLHKHELGHCWRADSADHVTWWVNRWPSVPVFEGWLEPLMLPSTVPLLNVALVMKPTRPEVAMAQATRALVSDGSSAKTRREMGQLTRTEHVQRESQGVRHEREVAHGHSVWRWEACVSTSAPAGNRDELDRRIQAVQAACAQARLGANRMWTMQERFFLRTLPLARGLRDR